MNEIGQIYQAPTVSFLVYESQALSQSATKLASKRDASAKWNSSETKAAVAAAYWSYKFKSSIFHTKWCQPMLLIEKNIFEDEIYCFILTGEKFGWISYNVEGEVFFQTLQPGL